MGVENVAEFSMLQFMVTRIDTFECSNAWGVLDAASLKDDDLGAETFCPRGVMVAFHFIALGDNGRNLRKTLALLKTTTNLMR